MPDPADHASRDGGTARPANPDLAGTTELRVHGVSGTTPQAMLGYPCVHRVSGDRLAGFYRRGISAAVEDRAAGDDDTHRLEGYSWAGLTSGSKLRALWLLLLPFLLVNMAYFARPPQEDQQATAAVASGRLTGRSMARIGRRFPGPVLRVLAVTLTASLVLAVTTASVDLAAWQCAGAGDCADRHGYLRWMSHGFWAVPGRRAAAATLLPLTVLGLLWWLGSRTWHALEQWPPLAQRQTLAALRAQAAASGAGAGTEPAGMAPLAPSSDVGSPVRLERPDFWLDAPPVGACATCMSPWRWACLRRSSPGRERRRAARRLCTSGMAWSAPRCCLSGPPCLQPRSRGWASGPAWRRPPPRPRRRAALDHPSANRPPRRAAAPSTA